MPEAVPVETTTVDVPSIVAGSTATDCVALRVGGEVDEDDAVCRIPGRSVEGSVDEEKAEVLVRSEGVARFAVLEDANAFGTVPEEMTEPAVVKEAAVDGTVAGRITTAGTEVAD